MKSIPSRLSLDGMFFLLASCNNLKTGLKQLLTYTSLLIVCLFSHAYGQEMNRYHIDIYNGLPSNHVYSTLVDRHGYLWICTDKGVVRYNGYEFKKFGLAEGLPNADVWQMIEDMKGRIWLLSISDEMGYVYNNEYKKIFFPNSMALRPGEVKQYGNGIFFISPYPAKSKNLSNAQGIVIEINDTFYSYSLANYLEAGRGFVTEYNEIGAIRNDTVFKLYIDKGSLKSVAVCNINDSNYYEGQMLMENNFPFLHNYVSYSLRKNYLKIYSLDNCDHRQIRLNDLLQQEANIYLMWPYKHNVYIVTEKMLCKLDSNFKLISTYKIDALCDSTAGIKTTDVSYLSQDTLWGISLSTYKAGVYLNNIGSVTFKKFDVCDLTSYQFAGSELNNSYWWSSSGSVLIKITNNKTATFIHRKEMPDIRNIVGYNDEKALVMSKTPGFNYWLYNNGELKDVLSSNTCFTDIGLDSERLEFSPRKNYFPYRNWRDVVIDSPNVYYAVIGTYGLCKYKIAGDTVIVKNIDYNIFNHIVYDSSTQLFWAYNSNQILIFDRQNNKVSISKEILKSYGIKSIEKILIDSKHGNVFIKDYNKLIVYNEYKNSFSQLYKNYNLEGSFIYLNNNIFITLGIFGILFNETSNIQSPPLVYANNKNQYYNFINDFAVVNNQILLKTDRGSYVTDIPLNKRLSTLEVNHVPYKVLLSYNNELYNLAINDTISIDQENPRLTFDVINPNGNGSVHYSYSIDGGSWQELNANELTFSGLGADRYYKLSLVAHDDTWRSNKTDVSLYVIPYWWQTTAGKRMLWISGFLIIALLGTIIALITRRIVQRNNEKKTSQLGLELNAIYSQINPHFIFNTLNTAQYFIKKKKTDEAFIHINKFSRLLRAYIKSARNKFITVDEELGNLSNYIELQQERFENRFDYQLIVDENEAIKDVKIPSLLLQPIVENAINHGIFHKEEKGHLKIQVRFGKNKNEIICVIEDDGIGRKRSKELHADSVVKRESFGDKLINDLINIFNKYEQVNIQLEYTDKEEPLTGTIVKLTIKNLQHDK